MGSGRKGRNEVAGLSDFDDCNDCSGWNGWRNRRKLFGVLPQHAGCLVGVAAVDPDLGGHARDVADAGVKIIPHHAAGNAGILQRLAPDICLRGLVAVAMRTMSSGSSVVICFSFGLGNLHTYYCVA